MKKNEQLALRYFVTELRTAKGKDSAITVGYLVDRWNMANPKKKIDDTGGKRIIRHIRNEGIIKRYKSIKPDYGSGHYLSIRESSKGNLLVSYHDDGNALGGESCHHGEINFGKRDQLLKLTET